jgi:hypothetical protein
MFKNLIPFQFIHRFIIKQKFKNTIEKFVFSTKNAFLVFLYSDVLLCVKGFETSTE